MRPSVIDFESFSLFQEVGIPPKDVEKLFFEDYKGEIIYISLVPTWITGVPPYLAQIPFPNICIQVFIFIYTLLCEILLNKS